MSEVCDNVSALGVNNSEFRNIFMHRTHTGWDRQNSNYVRTKCNLYDTHNNIEFGEGEIRILNTSFGLIG